MRLPDFWKGPYWEPRDVWVGVFWEWQYLPDLRTRQQINVYVCLTPCFPIRLTWWCKR